MSEKYINLKDEIRKDSAINAHVGIVTALRWLDEHPGQVPGRTITESELQKAVRIHESIRDLAGMLGVTIVPDPEPTNAEKLEKSLTDYALQRGGMRGGVDEIAAHLDKAGVKAPGGDDD